MTKPITKSKTQTLVHHPSSVLDLFGRYDSSSQSWCDFDENLSDQIEQLEQHNRQYIRVRLGDRRRSTAR